MPSSHSNRETSRERLFILTTLDRGDNTLRLSHRSTVRRTVRLGALTLRLSTRGSREGSFGCAVFRSSGVRNSGCLAASVSIAVRIACTSHGNHAEPNLRSERGRKAADKRHDQVVSAREYIRDDRNREGAGIGIDGRAVGSEDWNSDGRRSALASDQAAGTDTGSECQENRRNRNALCSRRGHHFGNHHARRADHFSDRRTNAASARHGLG
jgi:hypothetical protein